MGDHRHSAQPPAHGWWVMEAMKSPQEGTAETVGSTQPRTRDPEHTSPKPKLCGSHAVGGTHERLSVERIRGQNCDGSTTKMLPTRQICREAEACSRPGATTSFQRPRFKRCPSSRELARVLTLLSCCQGRRRSACRMVVPVPCLLITSAREFVDARLARPC